MSSDWLNRIHYFNYQMTKHPIALRLGRQVQKLFAIALNVQIYIGLSVFSISDTILARLLEEQG